MSKRLENKMDDWQKAIDTITADVNDPNPAVATRARLIGKLLGNRIAEWKTCDVAHTSYLMKEYGEENL